MQSLAIMNRATALYYWFLDGAAVLPVLSLLRLPVVCAILWRILETFGLIFQVAVVDTLRLVVDEAVEMANVSDIPASP